MVATAHARPDLDGPAGRCPSVGDAGFVVTPGRQVTHPRRRQVGTGYREWRPKSGGQDGPGPTASNGLIPDATSGPRARHGQPRERRRGGATAASGSNGLLLRRTCLITKHLVSVGHHAYGDPNSASISTRRRTVATRKRRPSTRGQRAGKPVDTSGRIGRLGPSRGRRRDGRPRPDTVGRVPGGRRNVYGRAERPITS